MKKINQAIELEILKFSHYKLTKWGVIYKWRQDKLFKKYSEEVTEMTYSFDELPDGIKKDLIWNMLNDVVETLTTDIYYTCPDRQSYSVIKRLCLNEDRLKNKLKSIRDTIK